MQSRSAEHKTNAHEVQNQVLQSLNTFYLI